MIAFMSSQMLYHTKGVLASVDQIIELLNEGYACF